MSKKLFKSASTVSSMTLLSRIMGLLRDIVLARIFGASAGADAFFIAFKIPNFLRRLFAEGAFAQAFVPVLSEYKTQKEADDVKDLVDHVTGSLSLILFIITLIAVIAAPILVMIFAPGFINNEDKFELTTQMIRITFPYLLFISLTALAGSILNSYDRFMVPAFTPVLLNLSLIGAALWLSPMMDEPIIALAWGVFIAGILQLALQLPFLLKLKLLPRPKLKRGHAGVKRIKTLMLPALFGSSIVQISLLFDTLIASFLITGSVSWLYYSDRIVEFPLGIFGIALATVILPNLSQKHANAAREDFAKTLDWALQIVFIIGIPCAVGLFILAEPIITTLFQYGAFSSHDAEMASLSLRAYTLGLLGFLLIKVLVTGFYARQDTRTPVRIGVIAMLSNMVLNVLFVAPMVMLSIEGPHAGLALATAVSAFINAGLLYRGLRQLGICQHNRQWPRLIINISLASLVMAALLIWGTGDMDLWQSRDWLTRAGTLFLWVGIGAISYFAVLRLSGVQLIQLLHNKSA